jgi:MFS family permease
MVLFPPLVASLIEVADWRFATEVLGLFALAVGIPCSLLIRDPPGAAVAQSGGSHIDSRRLFNSWRMTLPLLQRRTFLAIVIMFFPFQISTSLISTHFVNYATDVGISVVLAASMMSALGIANTTGRLIEGAFSDRAGIKAAVVVCSGLAMLSLILMAWNASVWMLWLSVVFAGFSFGGVIPLIPGLLSERFGTERLAAITGAAMGMVGIGSAIGPYLGGLVFDLSSSYSWALALSAAFLGVSLVLALLLGSAEREVTRK